MSAVKDNDNVFAFAAALLDPGKPECPFLYANDRMVRLAGYPSEQLVNRSLQLMFGAETDSETRLHCRISMQSGDYTEADLLCYRRSGGSFWNRITLTPIRDAGNQVVLFLMSGQDITRIRRLEDALLQSIDLTDRTVRSMQMVIEKTEARFQAVRQYQAVLVAHIERGWRRHVDRQRRAMAPRSIAEELYNQPLLNRGPSALMGDVRNVGIKPGYRFMGTA